MSTLVKPEEKRSPIFENAKGREIEFENIIMIYLMVD
ncbi:hypothetical protein C4J83_5283 [Pseudomonas sp. LBUM920]|nr:hypothetical protein C4J83_5283 [Pseudomonas sp. LBUM920]